MGKYRTKTFFTQSKKSWHGIALFSLILAVVIIGCSVWLLSHPTLPANTNILQFIDVGQGDASLIVTKQGCVLLDTGGQDTAEALFYRIRSYTDHLSYLILTHPHTDHVGGAFYILQHMQVDTVILPRDFYDTTTYTRLLDEIEQSDATVLFSEPDLSFTIGETSFRFLAPLANYEDVNETSAVIRMDYGEISILFTGDAGKESEEAQLRKYGNSSGGLLDTDILKAGHHGSSGSTTTAYLHAVTPDYVIISCGRDNEYGHPADSLLTRLEKAGAEILRTDQTGTVTFRTDGKILERIS